MIPGISSYTYTWAIGVPGSIPEDPLNAYGLIDKAVAAGVNLVQIADNLPLEILKSEELTGFKEYALTNGISIEMGSRGLTAAHTMKCLEVAHKIDSPVLRMVIDSHRFEPDVQTIISIIRDIVPELESRKIKLAIENHDRLKATEFEKVVQSVGSEMVGICLDSANSLGAGEGFETVCDILIPYTFNLHVKDFKIFRMSHKMGFIIEGRPAGQGMLNIKELFERIEDTGLCHSAILELWTPPAETIKETIKKESEWADISISYMKSLLDLKK